MSSETRVGEKSRSAAASSAGEGVKESWQKRTVTGMQNGFAGAGGNSRISLEEKGDPLGIGTSATPLWWAADGGHVEAVQCLLDYGADPRASDRYVRIQCIEEQTFVYTRDPSLLERTCEHSNHQLHVKRQPLPPKKRTRGSLAYVSCVLTCLQTFALSVSAVSTTVRRCIVWLRRAIARSPPRCSPRARSRAYPRRRCRTARRRCRLRAATDTGKWWSCSSRVERQ